MNNYLFFLNNLDTSITDEKSLTEYMAKFDCDSKTLVVKSAFGNDSIIGKFFLETGLDWPDEYYTTKNHYNPKYKQATLNCSDEELEPMYSRGVPEIHLARQGIAHIPTSMIKLMNNFFKIKKIAPLIVQTYRTSPQSFFNTFKHDYFLSEIAHQL